MRTSLVGVGPTCPRCGGTFDDDARFCETDGVALVGADPLLGSVVAGDIVLCGVAGEGACGRVYRGWQESVGRYVAVKVLHDEQTRSRDSVARFEREARIVSRLRHPHVVDIHLAGRLPDGRRFLAMEYVEGISLRDALAQAGGRLELARAIAIVLQACEGCAEAHDHGIIHRDLKPENIALVRGRDASDWVKILDFGIAKATDEMAATAAGLIFGTARYISPEGAAGGPVTPASDVYSLATILYELLVGETPFDGDDGLALLVKHIHLPAPDIRLLGAVPDAVANVVMANLAKDPTLRAPDARAFGRALSAALADAERSTRPSESRTRIEPPPPPDSLTALTATTSVVEMAPRRRWWPTVAGVVAGLAVAVGAEAAFHAQEASRTELATRVHDLDARAQAKRESGDLEGARETALRALELDGRDRAARSLAAQAERELAILDADPTHAAGAPVVTLVVPKTLKVGDRIPIIARVAPRSAGPSAKVEHVAVGAGEVKSTSPLALASAEREPRVFVAEARATAPGIVRITFAADVGGRSVYADRILHVEP